jgi:hypothetical protein
MIITKPVSGRTICNEFREKKFQNKKPESSFLNNMDEIRVLLKLRDSLTNEYLPVIQWIKYVIKLFTENVLKAVG